MDIVTLVLFFLIGISYGRPESIELKETIGINISAELNETMKAEVTQKLHKGTPNLLLNLGDTLKENLLKPTNDRNQGEQTVRGLHEYLFNLEDVHEMMKSKDKTENKIGMKLFRMLLEAGGPPHLDNGDIDIEDLMEKYQWNNKATYSVRKALDDTETVWEKMQIVAESFR